LSSTACSKRINGCLLEYPPISVNVNGQMSRTSKIRRAEYLKANFLAPKKEINEGDEHTTTSGRSGIMFASFWIRQGKRNQPRALILLCASAYLGIFTHTIVNRPSRSK